MNILLTGANGFIGRNFINSFLKNAGESDVLLAVTNYYLGYDARIVHIGHSNYRLDKEIKDYYVDIVIHLGGSIPTKSESESFSDANRYFNNIKSTLDLLEDLPNKPEKFIFASSVMVYENTHSVINENSTIKPSHMYGESKAYTERILSYWARDNDVKLQILRIGQVYGSGEENRLIIPTLIDKAINDEVFTVYTNGKELRSFIHVTDVADLIGKSMFLKDNNIINVASSHFISVLELANMIMTIANKNDLVEVKNGGIETRDYVYDCTKMHEMLGKEKIDLQQGLLEEYRYRKTQHSLRASI